MKPKSVFVRSGARQSIALSMVVGGAIVLASCSDSLSANPGVVPVNSLFNSYVALGNSITAGYQSGGINDSTQRESYAYLFAQQVNTRYAYASLFGSGCPSPVDTFPNVRNDTTRCRLRTPSSVAASLNNVAVPGATSLDPTSTSTFASNALTTFILGGKTQVGRAADARPTFVSAWIGNNDVLGAAISGILTPYPSSASPTISRGITPQATFETNYTAMIDSLKKISSIRGGILIGVVQAAAAPVLFPAAALQSLQFVGGLSAYAGTPITVHPSCLPGGSGVGSLISFQIISAIRDGTHPAIIVCSPGIVTAPVGDIFVLTTAEQATLASAISAYNAFIQTTATNLGWAYYDPNVTLVALKTSGCILPFPALGDRVHTFGECVSLDGVHPAKAAHIAIANTMIDSVNAKYSTTIPHVSTTLAP